ncbi:hypothetical protein GEV33_004886 [Tenebrio molitor]|uniref:Uncharacterized protein n=1 Tax=Tenebrio molitor TaxID=7067 RepID=A0A8J6HNI7_TENMO|nr:hypothetical protein GEV33_004886 [Tenebrio molitor]
MGSPIEYVFVPLRVAPLALDLSTAAAGPRSGTNSRTPKVRPRSRSSIKEVRPKMWQIAQEARISSLDLNTTPPPRVVTVTDGDRHRPPIKMSVAFTPDRPPAGRCSRQLLHNTALVRHMYVRPR